MSSTDALAVDQFQSFDGQVALVTGAGGLPGRGIGRAVAMSLARSGARVIAADIDIDTAQATATSINDGGGQAVAIEADVCEPEAIGRVFDFAETHLGPIRVLVNHAGAPHPLLGASVVDTDDETWRRTAALHLDAPFYAIRRALPSMIRSGGGAIVNTISVAGIGGGRSGAAYTAAKHGLVGLTRSVAATYASQGIRCNGVCPGRTRSAGTNIAPPTASGPAESSIPRVGHPDEIAAVITFLASDASSFVNGAIVPVDGGWTAI